MRYRTLWFALLAALVISTLPLVAQTSGTAASSTPAKTSTASTSTKGKSSSTTAGSKLDINAATADQLKALPGINDATAQKIIAGRPYHGKNDLVSKNIITKTEYDSIKDQIIAHHVQGTSTAAAGTTKK